MTKEEVAKKKKTITKLNNISINVYLVLQEQEEQNSQVL